MHTPPPAEVHREAVTPLHMSAAQADSARRPWRRRRKRPCWLQVGAGSVYAALPHPSLLTPRAVEQSSVAGKGGA